MIGGMVGNNSCGSNSVIYGSTRDHLLEVKGYLSDGSFVTFNSLTKHKFDERIAKIKAKSELTLEDKIYLHIHDLLSHEANQQEIRKEFPKRTIRRRNTGYAIDELLYECYTNTNQSKSFDYD